MAQLVQLEQRIMEILEFEVGGEQAALHIVGGVLDGAEIVNVEGVRHNHHAAGMLAGGALDAGAADAKAVFLGAVHRPAALLQILFHIAESSFILQAGDGARLEHVLLAEQLLGVTVYVGLVHTGEVQVDIRLFVAIESKEGLEGDVVALHNHGVAADRAFFVRQVKAVHVDAVVDPFAVLTFRAQIVGRHGVDLRNAGEMRHGGGTDGTTAAHLIAALVGVGHQLDRDDVQHRVAVAADGIQFLFQPLLQHIRQRRAVVPGRVLPRSLTQLFLGALDAGRIGSLGNGPQIAVNGGGNFVGVGDNDLVGFLLGEVAELVEHVRRGAVVQRRLIVGILESVARLQHGPVDSILRLLKMHVAGGNDRLVQFLAQLDDGTVEVLDRLDGVHRAVAHHKFVVAQRLHFQNVVIFRDAQQFLVGLPRHNSSVKLPCFTGRGEQQSLPVLVEQTAGHTGFFEEILGMGGTDDAVKVFEPHLILHQNDEMMIFLFQHLFIAAKAGVDLLHRLNSLFLKITEHDLEDAGQRHGIVHRPVMVEGRNLQVLVDGVQLIVAQARKQRLTHGQRVQIGVVKADARPFPCLADEQHIKAVGVVGHQRQFAAKFLERPDGLLRRGRVRHHGIIDAGQFHDFLRDGLAGIDKAGKLLFLVDLAVFHHHRADLGEALSVGIQPGGLGIKHHKAAGKRHSQLTVDGRNHVIHKVSLTAVDELEIRVLFVDVIGGQHGLRVALTDAVVGDGDGPVAHAVGQTDDLAGITESVHGAGLGVQMQLHPLFALRGVVLTLLALHLQHIVGHDDKVMLVFVVGVVAPHDERGAWLQPLPLGHILPFIAQNFQVDRPGIIRDGGKINLAAAALHLGGEHIAPDRHLAAIAQIVQRTGVGGLELFAVEQPDRLVGQLEALDGEIRRGLLLLEFDNGGLFLQILLKFFLSALVAGVLQPDDGQCAGALLNQFRQHTGQLHAVQNGASRVDTHQNTVLPKTHRLVFIEEPVHRHSPLFQFLDHASHRLGCDALVGEIVAQGQFIPGKGGFQRRTKAPAQRTVQRLHAAQAQNDLALGTIQFHPVHHNGAKGGAELLVCRELRPDLCDKWFQSLSSYNLWISSMNWSTILSRSILTFSPWMNSSASFLPPAMPISASRASPGPLTMQPIMAILRDFRKPSSFRRRSTSLAMSIMGYWVRPQVGQLMISGPFTAKPAARRMS